ncbi:ABC transporter ATP-binding protein [Corynebacterium timonense]|uniref:Iron complex transport system ATP-binding protein n=1 Tax=Corynebacterium timonense TaxID=441500 RepID=A0A1H1PMI3_9CORY|nr:ABC transporter ATP-binding protein [Corynebacterium timonense]SDS12257.1 iron complex transport system ATP-binding protein [Corynebacterium timonense]
MTRLEASGVALAYGDKVVCEDISAPIPDGEFTVIVGPNACGKSTLLKSLTRLLAPSRGSVLLDGRQLHTMPTKQVAREVGLLPQGPVAPDGVRVVDLVNRGRYPHRGMFSPWSPRDEEAVAAAMESTGVRELSGRYVDELSGGQRQRVWMAVALAQQTPILLLDEPTTYLDLSHQIELLELCRSLNRNQGHTLVAVLHDLNQAARYADHIIAMKDGQVVATGTPQEVITEELVAEVFGLDARVIEDPESRSPLVVPRWEHPRAEAQSRETAAVGSER